MADTVKLPAFDKPAGKLLRLPLRLVPHEATVRILRGPMRGMKWIAGASNHGCWLGLYEPDYQAEFLARTPKGGVVWDVGANVGFYSMLATRKARKVIAIEPLPANLDYLRRHIALNRLESRIEVHEFAATNYDGEGNFRPIPGNRSEGALKPDGAMRVRTARLDHFKSELPDVIKIDVEGNELEVLQGAADILLRKIATVFISRHTADLDCKYLLQSYGYSVSEMQGGEWLAVPAAE